MASDIHVSAHTEFISELKECAKLLADKLHHSDYEAASILIQALTKTRDQHIFQSVGRLTRGLHDAIVNFNVDADLSKEPPKIANSDIHDATNRLNYVMELTQKAAEKTMDMVDEAAPIAMNLGQEASSLRTEWARLKRREMTADEFRQLYERMDGFLGQMVTGTGQLSKNLQDIVLEQGFQDLTGQVLKRVIGLINDVEKDLVTLVRIAGQVEEVTGLVNDVEQDEQDRLIVQKRKTEPEGPQINKERADVVSGQDEVDDLLSSLGF
ncbi:protein phosphatase CheZ [Cellvibrio japonicus]|uniref:Protein phosphatase CheZ n=1 Tax=Cellvibrio japonicus (strain Ueda107) TaxID=498211 RepID=B3PIJ9_CELJU|nr:protein phosphatase CheZ [Cellvibrio japonicus]ACE84348.1 chemotaxis protein CheZ [Cellvibrio japonicus Ueda107]QEI12595.1 protein phosphatase CheZ [Cellvibrio japonicus]QEI16169.1 protein phosphatase CheZ [Cellvibrio japonicus]QEI19747.1 protein phosphatase CheZ [Cellvibrio japonicus]